MGHTLSSTPGTTPPVGHLSPKSGGGEVYHHGLAGRQQQEFKSLAQYLVCTAQAITMPRGKYGTERFGILVNL